MFLLLFSEAKAKIDMRLMDVMPTNVSFSRASTATRWGPSGKIENIAVNVPAFEYDPVTGAPLGLRYEPQKQNTFLQSAAFDQAPWTPRSGAVVTANASEAPDGSLSADLIAHVMQYSNVRTVVSTEAGKTYCLSVWARRVSGANPLYFWSEIPGNISIASFNPDSTWRRYSATYVATTTSLQVTIMQDRAESGWGSVLLWGAQFEEGAAPSSHIPTTSTVATRAADQLSFTIPSGVSALRYVFDNDTTQDVAVSAGAYTVPTNLNRPHIKRILSL